MALVSSIGLALALGGQPATPVHMTALRSQTRSQVPPSVPARPDPEVETVARANWRMVVAGDVLIGVGMGGFGMMVAGLAVHSSAKNKLDRLVLRDDVSQSELDETEARRALGFQLAIAGAATTAALVGTGIALVAVGNKRERQRREAANLSLWGTGPSPWFAGRRSAGLSWGWRF